MVFTKQYPVSVRHRAIHTAFRCRIHFQELRQRSHGSMGLLGRMETQRCRRGRVHNVTVCDIAFPEFVISGTSQCHLAMLYKDRLQ